MKRRATCYHCGQESEVRKSNRKACPKCSNPMWKSPGLGHRLSAAWKAFKCEPRRRQYQFNKDEMPKEQLPLMETNANT